MSSSSLPRTVALIAGAVILSTGVWAMADPRSFFDAVATFEPYNPHFLQDIGAFQIGLGAVLLVALRQADGLVVALVGVGMGSLAHLVSHVLGTDLGGAPAVDIPALAILSLALLVAGALRWRELATETRRSRR